MNSTRCGRAGKRFAYILWVILLCPTSMTVLRAQQTGLPVTNRPPPPPAARQSPSEEEEFIQPSRPGIADPAEFQKPGVLQLEYGYDANFRAEEFRTQQTTPLTLRFAASKRLLLDFTLDTVTSETDEGGARSTGVGDTRLGFQVLALEDTERHPA